MKPSRIEPATFRLVRNMCGCFKVCVYVLVLLCVVVSVICALVFTVLCIVCTVFCIVSFMYIICSVCTGVRTAASE
jgi:hypothetical protein